MELSEIIFNLENVLEKYLSRKYTPNIKNASFFNCERITSNSFTFNEKFNPVRIFNSNPDRLFEGIRFNYRIPQSRVYYREIQSPEFVLQSIHYFDDQVIIVKNIDQKNDILLETTEEIECIPDVTFSGNNLYNLSGFNQIIIIFKPSLVNEVEKIAAYWQKIIDEEITLHPLSQIHSNDFDMLCHIDQLWSELDHIGRKRIITVPDQMESDLYDYIWIQELYIHFGWFKELDDFYKNFNMAVLGKEQDYIKRLMFNRYQSVALTWSSDELDKSNYEMHDQDVHTSAFLNLYLNPSQLTDSRMNEKIQAFWEYFYIPARRLASLAYIQKNPDECIAFALLAQGRHFWWVFKLTSLLNRSLHGSKRVLFALLFQIKEAVNLRISKDGFTISCFPDLRSIHWQDRLLNHYRFQLNRQRAAESTRLDIDRDNWIHINKIVAMEYFPRQKIVKIRPFIREPLNCPHLDNTCSIAVADHKLQVDLIWSQFTINFSGNRFKFLRKKDRFQVSIKIKKGIESLFFNSSELLPANGLYQKQYLNIKKGKGSVIVEVFDQSGARISHISPSVKQIVLMGFVVDRYGTMKSDFQIYSNHKKSQRIKLDGMSNNVIPRNSDINTWELRGKYQLKKSINLSQIPELCNQLLYTDPEYLKNKLIIYIGPSLQDRFLELIEQCLDRLGFIPKLRKLSEFRLCSFYITIVISDQELGAEIFQTDLFRIISFNVNRKHIGLQIKESNYTKLFTFDFFQGLRL